MVFPAPVKSSLGRERIGREKEQRSYKRIIKSNGRRMADLLKEYKPSRLQNLTQANPRGGPQPKGARRTNGKRDKESCWPYGTELVAYLLLVRPLW